MSILIERSWSIVVSKLPWLLASMSPSKHLSRLGNSIDSCWSGVGVGPAAGAGLLGGARDECPTDFFKVFDLALRPLRGSFFLSSLSLPTLPPSLDCNLRCSKESPSLATPAVSPSPIADKAIPPLGTTPPPLLPFLLPTSAWPADARGDQLSSTNFPAPASALGSSPV